MWSVTPQRTMDSMRAPSSHNRMRMPFLIAIVWSAIAATAMAQTPALTETLTFPPIPVGAQRELRLRIKDLPSGGVYQVQQAPNAPFAFLSDARDLTVNDNDISIRVEFAPLTSGDFQDEVILRRSPSTGQNAYDVIRVRLFATAFVIERTDEIDFGGVMTGDSVKRAVLYLSNRNDDFNFEYVGSLDAPFHMITSQGPVRRGIDTLAVIIAFSPRQRGTYADTVGLVRRDRMGRRLDTAYIQVQGMGREMPAEKIIDLRDLIAGDYASRTVTVELPEKVNAVNFSYSVEPRVVAPYTSATITAPTAPSKSQKVDVKVIANPQKKVDETSTYMLFRKGPDDVTLDSTRIVVDVAASARPVRFTAVFDADTINARIGDTVVLNLRVRTTDPIDEPQELTSLSFDLAYNPTVFVPLLQSNQRLVVDNERQYLITQIDASSSPIRITKNGDVLTQVRGVIALGDADQTPLEISSVTATERNAAAINITGSRSLLRVTNVWRYVDGRMRLANPLQGLLVMDVDPNPVVSNSTLRLRNFPQGAGSLVIVDALGAIRADLTSAVRSGKRDFSVASSGTADVILQPGTYYARCAVESILGGTLNSIVRVFVVQ